MLRISGRSDHHCKAENQGFTMFRTGVSMAIAPIFGDCTVEDHREGTARSDSEAAPNVPAMTLTATTERGITIESR